MNEVKSKDINSPKGYGPLISLDRTDCHVNNRKRKLLQVDAGVAWNSRVKNASAKITLQIVTPD